MIVGIAVRLRALDPEDAPTVWSWYQDHEFSVLDGNIYPESLSSKREFLATVGRPSYGNVYFGIETDGPELIGLVSLKRGRPERRSAEFGIAIERARWNLGYGSEATRLMCAFGFREMNLHRISLSVRADNPRARRVYEKSGFVEEGRDRESHYDQGRWIDSIRMAILEHEFVDL